MKTVFAMVTGEEDKLPFHVKGTGIQQNQEHIIRPSGLPYYQWLHCIKGAGKLIIAGNEYRISEEMGFFFVPIYLMSISPSLNPGLRAGSHLMDQPLTHCSTC